jgi:RNA polymerase sigma-70 factor, ECF subfamily
MASVGEPSELLCRVGRGDLDAFAQLYDALAADVFGLVFRVVRNRHLAEEVTQDVFLCLWRDASSFDPTRGSPSGWVHVVARRRAVDAVRREQSQRRRAAALRREYVSPDTSASSRRLEDRDEIQTLMAGLTEIEREAIQLSYWEGLSGKELADRLGTRLATAKSRKRDAVMRMRRAFHALPTA